MSVKTTKPSEISLTQMALLWENEEAIITTSGKLFLSILKVKLKDETDDVRSHSFYSRFISDSKNEGGVIEVDKILYKYNCSRLLRLDSITAQLLEKGECMVYNKVTKKYAKKIRTQEYGGVIGPLCGQGGRLFFDEDIIIFRIMDWIS